MVADLKAHTMKAGDFVPGQKVRLIFHPPPRDKEGRTKSELFE